MEARKQILTISILTLILIAPAALAEGPAAEFKAHGAGFELVPKASLGAVGFELSVAGPGGFTWTKRFAAGSLPSFDAIGPDGQYKWELTAIPHKALNGERPAMSAKKGSIQSGSFTVSAGSLVKSDLTEGGFLKDQQILDDLIVDGSACIGQDCVNGESFGFDTIRIKENNLRIRAVDTSTTSSFPTNDWQITFNDSSNGGANKFSIDDINGGKTPFTIEANAPSHSLYVDDGGRLGFGTSTPVADLHVKSGNTPTLRLEQDGSSGFAAQTWDVAGNEANFFIRDASNGSTLPLRIFPAAPSNALTIEATTGDVGLGTTSPEEELHIQGAAADTVAIELNNDTSWRIRNQGSNGWMEFRNASTATTIPMRIADGAVSNLLLVGASDASTPVSNQVTVTGNLVITGTCSAGGGACDGVFSPDYALPSIEEHAAFMWENSYLPGVGPTPDVKTTINVFEKTTGILNELEKAHIYIEQLHQLLEARDTSLADIQQRLADLEEAQD